MEEMSKHHTEMLGPPSIMVTVSKQLWNCAKMVFVLQHFLQLQYYKVQFDNAGANQGADSLELEGLQGTVFDDILGLLLRMKDELITSLCEAVMMDIMARSREYRKDKWVYDNCYVAVLNFTCLLLRQDPGLIMWEDITWIRVCMIHHTQNSWHSWRGLNKLYLKYKSGSSICCPVCSTQLM